MKAVARERERGASFEGVVVRGTRRRGVRRARGRRKREGVVRRGASVVRGVAEGRVGVSFVAARRGVSFVRGVSRGSGIGCVMVLSSAVAGEVSLYSIVMRFKSIRRRGVNLAVIVHRIIS